MDPGLVSREDGRPSIPDVQSEASVIRRYHGLMDDEGADDVFIPPPPLPPSSSARLLPAEGSTGGMVNNSSVTHSTGATDATEDRANPGGLDWHHVERQLMAAQTKVDEVIARGTESSEECEDATSPSSIEVLTPPADEDQTSSEDTVCLMETFQEPSGTESDEEAVDVSPVDQTPVSHQVPETPAEDSDEDHVDTRSLNYRLTKSDWVRRESGSSETQVSQQPTSEDSEGTTRTEGDTGDSSRRIASDIRQGEKLLQRLQLVQQRQDGQMMETAQETRGKEQGELETEVDPGEVNLTDGAEMKEKRIHTVVDEEAKVNVTEKEKNESRKERVSLSTEDSEDDERDRWETADLSPRIDPRENPNVSSKHRFSAAETSMENQIQEENQAKQNLQRPRAVFNPTDNPDVLEIPFKTSISLEPLPSQVDQRSDWQFSEHKMQKEISQEIQRELVLVSQGKIPGGYSKEEIRKLEETKLLFEAFQQENPEGPTRLRKHPTSLIRGDVNPSVLERSWSLERFSLESSLRRHKQAFTPVQKHGLHQLGWFPPAAEEARSKTREGRESPILQLNPFFTLRPALALQPEVEKDIRQAREREEELRRQRSTLYGENRRSSREEEKSGVTQTLVEGMEDMQLSPEGHVLHQASTLQHFKGETEDGRGRLPLSPAAELQDLTQPSSLSSHGTVFMLRQETVQRETGARVASTLQERPAESEQSQQEPKVHRAGGQKAPLWQRWESGQITGTSRPRKTTEPGPAAASTLQISTRLELHLEEEESLEPTVLQLIGTFSGGLTTRPWWEKLQRRSRASHWDILENFRR
ncbi:unnamed protein product [Pleuronectes platessa]|uniref:A-kinase anchor protein 2 C-terminal domain-containing protein n=1 Tax=Pleuronectes platessa TaxID=8262 RepID=A0A9N7UNJ3_PLEPL|nr:unnamed protein product [Pleuronectes platessa]